MKRLVSIIAVAAIIFATGCQRTDFDEILRRQEKQLTTLNDHEARLKAIEAWTKTVNTDIATLKGLVDALQKKVSIVSYKPLADGSGYELAMSDGSKITLKNGDKGDKGDKGDAPFINVKAHTDGRLYWTINGEWMLDAGGNKIPATGEKGDKGDPGVTPKMRVNTAGNWEVSIDGGATWQEMKDDANNPVPATGAKGDKGDKGDKGEDGDAQLTITETADAITIVYKGATYTIPKGGGSTTLTLDKSSLSVKIGKTETAYVLTGSGAYSATSDKTSVATVSVTATNINIKGVNWGTATITVKDTKTNETKTIAVTVPPNDLVIDKTTLGVGIGSAEFVNITDGSGNYTVTSNNTSVATATLSGTKVTINGIALGNAVITVKDNQSSQTKTISVEVKALSPIVGKWKMTSKRNKEGGTWGDWETPSAEYWLEYKADGTWKTSSFWEGTYTYNAATKILTMTGNTVVAFTNYDEISLTDSYWEFTCYYVGVPYQYHYKYSKM